MTSLISATFRDTKYDDEQDRSRMNDEGCPNDLLPNLPHKTGIESVCESLGGILDRPESLGYGDAIPQPLPDLVRAVRRRLTVNREDKLNLEDEGDLISSIIGYR